MRWAGFCLVAVIVTATQATPAGAKTQSDAKISKPLFALAQSRPNDEFAVIVRASSKVNNGHHAERAAAAVKRAQGKVGRGLSIVGGASALLTGEEILALANDQDVAFVSLDEVVTATFDPLDGAALASSPGIVEVGAPEAWRQLRVTGKGIGVAILDSGIAPHPDLAGRIVASVDFTSGGPGALVAPADPGGHGTHVAGLVAGDGTASGGAYAGVAPGANLIDVRVISATGSTNVSTLIAGLQWVLAHRVTYNIRVVNLSAGRPATTSYRDDPLATAVEVLVFAGITVVVSAGNEGPQAGTITSPGNDPFVITVGGIDDSGTAATGDDALASWSSRGVTPIDGLAKPDLVAPGRGFASEVYALLYGQPLIWRDAAFNDGVDSNGVPWSGVSWSNVVWDTVTWQNVSWEAFVWSGVSWEDISWEDISWESISWEDISWELVPHKGKGNNGHRGGKVLD